MQYSLYDGFSSKDDHPYVHINSVTGEICVSQDIDHEAGLVTFDLSIKAEDQVSFVNTGIVEIDIKWKKKLVIVFSF